LRALIMHLEGLSSEEILKRELATGVPIIYTLDAKGGIAGRKDLVG
jgi:2,3-bisphosphoglycerate-dependent phosphoglycerate mutase